MLRFIARRILIFIPTFFVITLLAFYLSEQAPGDPMRNQLGIMDTKQAGMPSTEREMKKIADQMALNRPDFYFALSTMADCDTLYRVVNKRHRKNLDHLTHTYGNWDAVSNWYLSLKSARRQLYLEGSGKETSVVMNIVENLLVVAKEKRIARQLDSLNRLEASGSLSPSMSVALSRMNSAFREMRSDTRTWELYVPSINWHGLDNRYHYWLFGREGEGGVLRGDFGISYDDGEKVSAKIWRKLRLSIELIMISILLGYLVSLPIGVFSARRRDSLADRSVSILLYALYSLPNFFVGTILLFLFSNPDNLVWFEGSGYKDPNLSMDEYYGEMNYFGRLVHSWPYMILPIVTYTYASLAFISRVMRTSLLENMNMDYIRTARAKGLSERKMIWKHAMRNSLLPIITMFASIFPMAIGGSIIVEFIFGYPGMGSLSIEAIRNNDYPVLIAVFTLAGFMTMIGYLVADILYLIVDPRISYSRKS